MSNLSQRLQDGLIGEDSEAVNAGKYANTQKRAQDDLRQEQRDRVKPTIATIKADLKGLMPKKIVYPNPPADTSVLTPEVFDYYVAAAQFDYSYAAAYNQALADIDAAIEHYTRGE